MWNTWDGWDNKKDGSVLGQMFACKKDMFYRFLSNEDINWRQIVYSFNRRLLGRIAMRSDSANSKDPRFLIADDIDFPKTGRKGEFLGLILIDTVTGYRSQSQDYSTIISAIS